jgi:hypothetical protein
LPPEFDLPERPPDRLNVRLILRKDASMSIRPIALSFGLAVMSGFAVTAHAGTYDVTRLADQGGVGNNVVFAINSLGESVGYSSTPTGLDAVLWSATGTATLLADAGGQEKSAAVAINASGQTVGGSRTVNGEDPVLWSSLGKATSLGKGGAFPSAALAINAKGWSVGYITDKNGLFDAFLWHPKGVGTMLKNPGGQGVSQALAVNGAGQSVGYVDIAAPGKSEAVLWGPKGGATLLQDVAGGVGHSEAVAINASGFSVGWAFTATGEDAVRWSPLAGTPPTVLQGLKNSTVSVAVAENNVGQSIGYSDTAKGARDAILWGSKGGIAAVLQDPGGQGFEQALAMNNSGKSVGFADIAGGGKEAVLWQPSGKPTNLGGLLGSDWTNTEAVGINNVGDIVGYGLFNNGTVSGTFGFLLTPSAGTAASAIPGSVAAAPELSTWAMLVVGFAGLGFVGYRGKRKGEARCEGLA